MIKFIAPSKDMRCEWKLTKSAQNENGSDLKFRRHFIETLKNKGLHICVYMCFFVTVSAPPEEPVTEKPTQLTNYSALYIWTVVCQSLKYRNIFIRVWHFRAKYVPHIIYLTVLKQSSLWFYVNSYKITDLWVDFDLLAHYLIPKK